MEVWEEYDRGRNEEAKEVEVDNEGNMGQPVFAMPVPVNATTEYDQL